MLERSQGDLFQTNTSGETICNLKRCRCNQTNKLSINCIQIIQFQSGQYGNNEKEEKKPFKKSVRAKMLVNLKRMLFNYEEITLKHKLQEALSVLPKTITQSTL